MISRSLAGYFCDDIRQELGGKTSLIGCYGPEMVVQAFPVTLPKLCVTIQVKTPAEQPFTNLKVVLFRGEEVLAEGELPPDVLQAAQNSNLESSESDVGDSFRSITATVNFTVSPLILDEPANLRARAFAGKEVLKGLSLRVRQATVDEIARLFV